MTDPGAPADVDPLTGVASRRRLFDAVRAAITDVYCYGERASLAYFDVDDLKAVNDEAGHAAGDALLREVARSLRDGLRHSEVVGRVGGDEFAAVLRCGGAEGRARARALALAIPVSWGVAELTLGCTLQGAFEDANAAMFAMKGPRRPR